MSSLASSVHSIAIPPLRALYFVPVLSQDETQVAQVAVAWKGKLTGNAGWEMGA
jgi:hypothetical protein